MNIKVELLKDFISGFIVVSLRKTMILYGI